MVVRTLIAALGAAVVSAQPVQAQDTLTPAAKQWWADISALANDDMKGRQTGSADYLRAADYVIGRFKAIGLEPKGVNGFFQPIAFESQVVDQSASSAALVGTSSSSPLKVGEDILISGRGGPAPTHVDAPLVFVGYGLHLPKQGHDDFAGLDLKGKIVVVLSGGPADLSGPVKSNARAERGRVLAKLGAVGMIALTTPKQVEIPWARQKLLAPQPAMYLADAGLRDTANGFFSASFDPEKSEALFEGSGHSFGELCALADGSKPLPIFALKSRLKADVVAHRTEVSSPNLIAELPGSDSKLRNEYVAVSAHLDHLGVGAPIKGDAIYNGAMDDASGVASVLDIAAKLKAGPRPRRGVLFVIVTAEEKGLLGSHYFAAHPTVPKGSIVADFNFDMALPLWKLTKIFAPGENESTLGADARAVAQDEGLSLTPDPLPDRNVFIRTDQFSFVKQGVPALAFKFGFTKDTPEFQIEHDWRANRYHAPSDDLDQPGVMKDEAVKLDAFVATLTARVANANRRPEWLPTSVFAHPE